MSVHLTEAFVFLVFRGEILVIIKCSVVLWFNISILVCGEMVIVSRMQQNVMGL